MRILPPEFTTSTKNTIEGMLDEGSLSILSAYDVVISNIQKELKDSLIFGVHTPVFIPVVMMYVARVFSMRLAVRYPRNVKLQQNIEDFPVEAATLRFSLQAAAEGVFQHVVMETLLAEIDDFVEQYFQEPSTEEESR